MSKKIEEGYLIPIIRIRIEKMTQLLRESMNVSEAAMQLGFSDIKNISRSFRQLKNITPSEYRQQVMLERRNTTKSE